MTRKATIVTIGDEILIGQVVDTNSTWISQKLSDYGIEVQHTITCRDKFVSILDGLQFAYQQSEFIIVTGGLGPTKDDITKKVLAEFTQDSLQYSEIQWKHIENYFQNFLKSPSKAHELQAWIPSKAHLLHNPEGTAMGLGIIKETRRILSLPGVPSEMQSIMNESGIAWLLGAQSHDILRHTFMTVGTSETVLEEKLSDISENLPPHFSIAYLPSLGIVRIRLTAQFQKGNKSHKVFHDICEKIRVILSPYSYGENDEELSEAVGLILKKKNALVGVAESCTGGYLSHLFTSVSGASSYFKGGIIAYDNEIKTSVLDIPLPALEKYGAVSEEVVIKMVKGTCQYLGTSYAIATSGIAGPTGSTPEKPVGMVWIAAGNTENVRTQRLQLGGRRIKNIKLSSVYALNLLRNFLLE